MPLAAPPGSAHMDASTCRYTDSEMKGTSAYFPLPHAPDTQTRSPGPHNNGVARMQHLRTALQPYTPCK